MFSFYVKIEREKSEDENANEIKSQLQSIEEIESINLLYFKRYFNRLQFNEVVIDFVTTNSAQWKKEPKQILRKLCGYNDAYKFSQLKIENPYIVWIYFSLYLNLISCSTTVYKVVTDNKVFEMSVLKTA